MRSPVEKPPVRRSATLHSQKVDHFLHPIAQTPPRDPMQASGKRQGLARRQPRVQPGVIQQAADAPL
jgi:hypothetical protein